MLSAGFEPAIPTFKQLQTCALDGNELPLMLLCI